MEQVANLKAIMDKVARLKTLAERPGTPEEAAAAAAAIQRLMTRHNLSQMQIDMAERNTERGFERVFVDLGAMLRWRYSLMNDIATSSYCSFVRGQRGGGHIVGEQHNVIMANELYQFLVNEIERLAQIGWDMSVTYDSKRTWLHSFRVGAAVVVGDRLMTEWRAQKKEQQSDTSALVVLYEEDLNKAVAAYFPNMRTSSVNLGTRSADGYSKGRRAGAGINLAKQIGR